MTSYYKDLDRKQIWAYEKLENGDAFEILRSSTEGTFLVSRNQEKHDEIKKNASRVATIYYVSSSGAIISKSIYCQQNMNFVIYSVRETNFWFRSITSLMKHIVREKILLSDTLLTKAFEKTYI
ncbi:Protein CBG21572 [Caenorhabditis briggsae]|uniref:Protein CBG21572 n=1 Tax=Caenorhabditis briggsae TaxID=6238 RepID=A8Y0E6_CAEBR|nr:Protein CBG21572 [Caenorhabditis briggsae]CAP38331.1 Protein CBG21572 [Caenorhabditis briggsae]